MTQELAPSDWTQQTFEDTSSVSRGIIRAIDEQLGIGIISPCNYGRGNYLVFFLCDIDRNNGWQHGIGEGDNVEFELVEMTRSDQDFVNQSYLSNSYNYNLSKSDVAINLLHLENGTVILEELLFDHPRYSGVIVKEPNPSIQHHAFGSYYGEEEPKQGLIRLEGEYPQTQIPPINKRYNVPSNTDGNNNNDEDGNNKKVLLPRGTMLHFEGRDLLTSRIVLRKGDKVEFDVYRDKSNQDVPFGATNIVFLDPNPEQRQHGFIMRFLSRQQSQYGASEQKFGLIKSMYDEELFWHQSEILDRDEVVQIGDEVEFVREVDEMHGRLKASRITFLPKHTIQLTELSKDIFMGKVESSTGYNKAPLIEYSNPQTGQKQLIEVQSNHSDHYILVKGDVVQFRTESKHENPTFKRAVHVVVTKEVDRTHKGSIYKLQKKASREMHNVANSSQSNLSKLMNMFGEIEYHDRGGKKHTIYFYLSEWFDPNIDIYEGLNVEFNILESGNKQRAVRIRPLILPQTKEERLLERQRKQQKEKEQRERERMQREQRQHEIKQRMINEHLSSQQQTDRSQPGPPSRGRKPPVLRGQYNIQSMNIPPPSQQQSNNQQQSQQQQSFQPQSIKMNDNVSIDNSHKSLSKAKQRKMRKKRNKNKKVAQQDANNNNNQLTQANIDNNQKQQQQQTKPPMTSQRQQQAQPTDYNDFDDNDDLSLQPPRDQYTPRSRGSRSGRSLRDRSMRRDNDITPRSNNTSSTSRGRGGRTRGRGSRRGGRGGRGGRSGYDDQMTQKQHDQIVADQPMAEQASRNKPTTGSNPIPSFDTMIPIEGIVLNPMRSKHGRGVIRYKWLRKRRKKEEGKVEYEDFEEEKTVEYDYDQKANWQRRIFLTEGDRVRLFFRTIDEDSAQLAYVALLDPVYKQRMYGECYYYHPTKSYYLQNSYGSEYIELWPYHIVDKKVQKYNLENELIVFDLIDRVNYNNDNKIATRCRWVRLDDKQWFNGRIKSLPTKMTNYGKIQYEDPSAGENKEIRYSLSSLSPEYRHYHKVGDDVKFHIEHVVTKSTYDVIAPTAVHVDSRLLYRPKSKGPNQVINTRSDPPPNQPPQQPQQQQFLNDDNNGVDDDDDNNNDNNHAPQMHRETEGK